MRSSRRGLFALVGVGALLLASALAVRAATTAPPRQGDGPPLESFEPETVGRLEQEAWAAYYYRDWPKLFTTLLDLIEASSASRRPRRSRLRRSPRAPRSCSPSGAT